MQVKHHVPLDIQEILNRGVTIDGDHLTILETVAVARFGARVTISPTVRAKVNKMRDYIENAVRLSSDPNIPEEAKKEWLIYGISTGFGNMKKFPVENIEDAKQLQENIIYSHAVGVGDYLSAEVVRAMMLLRINAFAKGSSGVRYELIEMLVELLNNNIHPLVPEQGSVGASGDLCPLAHMSLILLGEGMANIDRRNNQTGIWETIERVTGQAALNSIEADLHKKGIHLPFELSYKEGLALTNGTAMMTAMGVLIYFDALHAMKHADIAAALALEAIAGRSRPFESKVPEVRPHAGQKTSAANVRKMIKNSKLVDQNRDVQNAYSIRCIPQVHGASRDAIEYVRKVLEIELNSVTDNPLFFEPDEDVIDGKVNRWEYSAGNYHGQPIALAMDFMAIALSEIANISERRIQKILDVNYNYGPPANLALKPGLNSGLMMLQYTAAALVSENKVLSHPASVDSIPTASNIEDHVSMGPICTRKALKILQAVETVVAIEFVCMIQALDFRLGLIEAVANEKVYENEANAITNRISQHAQKSIPDFNDVVAILKTQSELKAYHVDDVDDLGDGTKVAYKVFRDYVPAIKRDDEQELHTHIKLAKEIIQSKTLLAQVESEIGGL